MPRSFKVRYIPCPVKSCTRQFTNQGGLKNHIRMHRKPQANPVHQPAFNEHEQDVPVDIQQHEDVQEEGLEDLDHPLTRDGTAREEITYHPLINGLQLLFICKNVN